MVGVTGRGITRTRGWAAASAPAFADAVAALGIDAGDGVPILTDPLAGLAPKPASGASPLATALRQRLATSSVTAMLGPKVSIVIDGGSALHLDTVRADIRLR